VKKNIFPLFLFCCFLLTGCANKVDLGPGYEVLSKHFLQAMRWQDFQGAAVHLQDGERRKLLASFDGSEDLHIVDAEYKYSRPNKKMGTAESELILEYYLLPSTRVKEWVWKMDWVLIPVDTKQRGTWQIQGAPPAFP
jgi:hypothetical protein